jgi:hypothetical protein
MNNSNLRYIKIIKTIISGFRRLICIVLSCLLLISAQAPLFAQQAKESVAQPVDLSKTYSDISAKVYVMPTDNTRVYMPTQLQVDQLRKQLEEKKLRQEVAYDREAAAKKELSDKLKMEYKYGGYDKTGYLEEGLWKGKRRDGSERNTGFFGEIVLQGGEHRGKVITESTVIIKKNGREYEVPLLNPMVIMSYSKWDIPTRYGFVMHKLLEAIENLRYGFVTHKLPEDIENLRYGFVTQNLIKKAGEWLDFCLLHNRGFFAEGKEIIPQDKWPYVLYNMLGSISDIREDANRKKGDRERIMVGEKNPYKFVELSEEWDERTLLIRDVIKGNKLYKEWEAAEGEIRKEEREKFLVATRSYSKEDAVKRADIEEEEYRKNEKKIKMEIIREKRIESTSREAVGYGLIGEDEENRIHQSVVDKYIENRVEERFERYLKKESLHNIANHGIWNRIWIKTNYFFAYVQNNSIIGKTSLGLYAAGAGLINWSNVGDEYRKKYQQNQNYLDYYNAGTEFSSVQRLALGVGSLGMDAGAFKVLGGVSSALSSKVIQGVSATAGYTRSALATGNTLGLYNGISTFGDILGEKPIKDFGWEDIGKIGYETGKGYAIGSAIGVFGESMRVLTPDMARSSSGVDGKWRWLGETAVEGGGIFPIVGAGWDYAWGDKEAFEKITFENIWQGIITIGIMKLSTGGKGYRGGTDRSNIVVKDYYAVLGVKGNAVEADIKAAYRNKAQELHPDKCIGCSESEIKARNEKMSEVNEAKDFFDRFFALSKDYNIEIVVKREVEKNPEGGYNAVERVALEVRDKNEAIIHRRGQENKETYNSEAEAYKAAGLDNEGISSGELRESAQGTGERPNPLTGNFFGLPPETVSPAVRPVVRSAKVPYKSAQGNGKKLPDEQLAIEFPDEKSETATPQQKNSGTQVEQKEEQNGENNYDYYPDPMYDVDENGNIRTESKPYDKYIKADQNIGNSDIPQSQTENVSGTINDVNQDYVSNSYKQDINGQIRYLNKIKNREELFSKLGQRMPNWDNSPVTLEEPIYHPWVIGKQLPKLTDEQQIQLIKDVSSGQNSYGFQDVKDIVMSRNDYRRYKEAARSFKLSQQIEFAYDVATRKGYKNIVEFIANTHTGRPGVKQNSNIMDFFFEVYNNKRLSDEQKIQLINYYKYNEKGNGQAFKRGLSKYKQELDKDKKNLKMTYSKDFIQWYEKNADIIKNQSSVVKPKSDISKGGGTPASGNLYSSIIPGLPQLFKLAEEGSSRLWEHLKTIFAKSQPPEVAKDPLNALTPENLSVKLRRAKLPKTQEMLAEIYKVDEAKAQGDIKRYEAGDNTVTKVRQQAKAKAEAEAKRYFPLLFSGYNNIIKSVWNKIQSARQSHTLDSNETLNAPARQTEGKTKAGGEARLEDKAET